MNSMEALALLTKAALIDPRMKRVDPQEQADRADAWASVLPDVSLKDADWALEEHYRSAVESIMPADVLRLVDPLPAGMRDWDAEPRELEAGPSMWEQMEAGTWEWGSPRG